MLRVVIPTRDSARWIGLLLEAYRERGIEPLYILDTRSADATRDILTVMKADVISFTPAADYVEAGMIEFGSRAAQAEWVLRLDDDEFPSDALLDWVAGATTRSVRDGFYVSRRDLFRRDGRIVYNRRRSSFTSAARPRFLNPHARLYRPSRLGFHQALHASGIVDETLFGFAPAAAFFVHVSALVTSPAERLEKVRRYEAIATGSTWRLADEYLPELFGTDHLSPAGD
ncbi:glycosyltransferase, partial [Rhodoplanes roseus]